MRRLPSDSRLVTHEQFGENWEGWTTENQFSAMSYEALVFLLHTLKQANSEKAIKPVPEPLKLPGRENKNSKDKWAEMLKLARQHAGKG